MQKCNLYFFVGNKADNEAKKEEEPEVPPEGIKASVAFKWRKAMVNMFVEFEGKRWQT